MDERVQRCNNLIKKIQKGKVKALDDLFREFGPLFLNMARKYLYDKRDAEDILSEVFVDLVRTNAQTFDGKQNGLNWLFTVIRRKAYKYNGANKVFSLDEPDKKYFTVDHFAGAAGPDEENAIDVILLKDGMEKLTEEENNLLYLKFWEGLTVREIAKKLDKPRSTVQYKIEEALKKLKDYCDRGGEK